ncbi:hypothetical protein Aca07nite_07840 [Actinoplanes capillaceus]|uniref:EspG family protein n=1 Tax=Actinoplanes campanulatus TaxID=113559 RepID=A0ABQ3WA74_9ACTN|nr:hypothetical protein [Actinoplanes capillaceus]GID43509.1 hypothetical protein Aca07nite_07840 [Actinoplanes capillaceus]
MTEPDDLIAIATAATAGRALEPDDETPDLGTHDGCFPPEPPEKQALFEEMRRELLTPKVPPTWTPAPEDTVLAFMLPDAAEALRQREKDVGQESLPLLADVIGSPAYPFVEGCAPDVIARRLAELVPTARVELHDNFDGTVSLTTCRVYSDDANVRTGEVEIDLRVSEESPHGMDWRVIGWSLGSAKLIVELPVSATPDDLDMVIPTLRAAGVLPEATR